MSACTVQLSPLITAVTSSQKSDVSIPALDGVRKRATERLCTIGLPRRGQEAWRFFDTRQLERTAFEMADPESSLDHSQMLKEVRLPEASSSICVILNGVFRPELSTAELTGLHVTTLDRLSDSEQARLVQQTDAFTQHTFPNDPFVALNEAAISCVNVLSIDPDTALDAPIHIIYIADGASGSGTDGADTNPERAPTMTHPRLIINVGNGANATVIEEWLTDESKPFVNAFTHIQIGENANLHHIRVQRSHKDAFHIDRLGVDLHKDARYDSCSYTYGAAKARTDLHLRMAARDTWARIDGVAVITGSQEADTHSVIENASPHVTSHQLHKIVVGGQAHGVFNGNILVRPGAQQIEAYQLNRNLLLSDRARIDAKPQLEIFADDVACSHGSATGQLDQEQLFYLETRGITHDDARAFLTYAFAAEVIENIDVRSLKRRLADEIYHRIQHDR